MEVRSLFASRAVLVASGCRLSSIACDGIYRGYLKLITSSLRTVRTMWSIEAEELKKESYGVELLHAVGLVYTMKVRSFRSLPAGNAREADFALTTLQSKCVKAFTAAHAACPLDPNSAPCYLVRVA